MRILRTRRSVWLLLLTLAAVLTLASCADMAYYGQALSGHWQLIEQRRDLDDLLADGAVAEDLRAQLRAAREIREFASQRLGLPDNDSYRSYVDTGRRHVVYNVFAAPALSLQSKTWCFPLAGCVGYRGYFNRGEADRYAASLRRQGLDTFVAGVPAYSTLGWFEDPLLNTFVHWPSSRLAELIFHELSHQKIYIADDTPFNESFATAVGQIGTELWLRDNVEERSRYRRYRQLRREFLDMVLDAKRRLARLYADSRDPAEKQRGKADLIDDLRRRHAALKAGAWDGYRGYDHWFGEDLNNAKLAAFGAYVQYVPAFLALFDSVGGDFGKFYRAAGRIGKLPPSQRRRQLRMLAERSAPADTTKLLIPVPGGLVAEQPRHHALDRGRSDA